MPSSALKTLAIFHDGLSTPGILNSGSLILLKKTHNCKVAGLTSAGGSRSILTIPVGPAPGVEGPQPMAGPFFPRAVSLVSVEIGGLLIGSLPWSRPPRCHCSPKPPGLYEPVVGPEPRPGAVDAGSWGAVAVCPAPVGGKIGLRMSVPLVPCSGGINPSLGVIRDSAKRRAVEALGPS